MLSILALFQDRLTACYQSDTQIIYDTNINLLQIMLARNQSSVNTCQQIDQEVRVNLTINTPLGNKVPLITTTVQNFSYLETNQIVIQNALDPVVEFGVIYYAQIDIYTYGKVLSIQTSNFIKQQSNLEACYYDISGAIFRDRVEIILKPTGICTLQMQTKKPGLLNYLQGITFQTNGVLLDYNLTLFNYSQKQQTLIFYADLVNLIFQDPFLEGKLIFNSNQGGNIISFGQNINNISLNTIANFFQQGEVGMWDQQIYTKLSFNQDLYQSYLDVQGGQTTFKLSIQLNNLTYSFQKQDNQPIINNHYIVIKCRSQIIQLQQICQKLVEKQSFDEITLDIISLKDNNDLSSIFKIQILPIQTCWNRAFATRQGNQFKINLYNNHNCDIKQGQLKLFNANNDLVLEDIFVNNTYQHVYYGDFESELYTMVLESNGEQYYVVIDQIKHIKADYATILAVTVGSCFIIYCLILFVITTISLITRRKRNRSKKQV